jgi:hypothetical protein
MPEHGPGSEGEAKFTPTFDLPEVEPGSREPINDEPIELTADEKALILSAVRDPESPEVRALMETKGIPYNRVVKVKVDDRVYNMTTDPNDFGTWVQ